MNLAEKITSYPGFPKEGIVFRDIGPLLSDPKALNFVLDSMIKPFNLDDIDLFAGIESRGFPFACALAAKLNKGMVMVRKAGKLPGAVESIDYDIEYGQATMEIQSAAILPGQSVLICDDLLATGGTASAAAKLIERIGGSILGFSFVVELTNLKGADKLQAYPAVSLVKYDSD